MAGRAVIVAIGDRLVRVARVKRQSDAMALYCPQCERIIPGSQYWSLSRTKGLHEHGTGHAPYYATVQPVTADTDRQGRQ